MFDLWALLQVGAIILLSLGQLLSAFKSVADTQAYKDNWPRFRKRLFIALAVTVVVSGIFPPLSRLPTVQAFVPVASVPNVTGLSISEARMVLEQSGFECALSGDVPSDTGNELYIVERQSPPQDSMKRKRTSVELTISRASLANRSFLVRETTDALVWRRLYPQKIGLLFHSIEFDEDEYQWANIEIFSGEHQSIEATITFSSHGVYALTNEFRKDDTSGRIGYLDHITVNQVAMNNSRLRLTPFQSIKIRVRLDRLRPQDHILDYTFNLGEELGFGEFTGIKVARLIEVPSADIDTWLDNPIRTVNPRMMY